MLCFKARFVVVLSNLMADKVICVNAGLAGSKLSLLRFTTLLFAIKQ